MKKNDEPVVEAPQEEEKPKEPVTLAEYEEAMKSESAKLEQMRQAGRMLNQEITNCLIKLKTFEAVIKALKDNGK